MKSLLEQCTTCLQIFKTTIAPTFYSLKKKSQYYLFCLVYIRKKFKISYFTFTKKRKKKQFLKLCNCRRQLVACALLNDTKAARRSVESSFTRKHLSGLIGIARAPGTRRTSARDKFLFSILFSNGRKVNHASL